MALISSSVSFSSYVPFDYSQPNGTCSEDQTMKHRPLMIFVTKSVDVPIAPPFTHREPFKKWNPVSLNSLENKMTIIYMAPINERFLLGNLLNFVQKPHSSNVTKKTVLSQHPSTVLLISCDYCPYKEIQTNLRG